MPPIEKIFSRNRLCRAGVRRTAAHSSVFTCLVETGGVTAVLGRNGCGKSCLMKIVGSLKAGFCSMRIDAMAQTVYRKGDSLPSAASVHSRMVAGWNARPAISGRLKTWNGGFEFISRGTLSGAVGRGTAILECFIFLQPCSANPARRAVLAADCTPHAATRQTLIRQEKATKGFCSMTDMYSPRDRHCRPLYCNNRDGQAYPCENDEDLVRRGYPNHL